jgi:hypothetical protein
MSLVMIHEPRFIGHTSIAVDRFGGMESVVPLTPGEFDDQIILFLTFLYSLFLLFFLRPS